VIVLRLPPIAGTGCHPAARVGQSRTTNVRVYKAAGSSPWLCGDETAQVHSGVLIPTMCLRRQKVA
jgi:hypothetical protein